MRVILLILALSYLGCKSKEKEQKESINRTLTTYLTERLKEIDSTFTLDSLRVIKVAEFSSKDELKAKILSLQDSLEYLLEKGKLTNEILKATIDQYKALAYLNNLGSSQSDLSIFKENVNEKKEDSQKIIDQLNDLNKQSDSLKSIYYSNKVDSTNFLSYGVTYKVCYSNKKLEQKCFDSAFLNITKDFRIAKKD